MESMTWIFDYTSVLILGKTREFVVRDKKLKKVD